MQELIYSFKNIYIYFISILLNKSLKILYIDNIIVHKAKNR